MLIGHEDMHRPKFTHTPEEHERPFLTVLSWSVELGRLEAMENRNGVISGLGSLKRNLEWQEGILPEVVQTKSAKPGSGWSVDV